MIPAIWALGAAAFTLIFSTSCSREEKKVSEGTPSSKKEGPSGPQLDSSIQKGSEALLLYQQLKQAGVTELQMDRSEDQSISEIEMINTTEDLYKQTPQNDKYRSLVQGTFKTIAARYVDKAERADPMAACENYQRARWYDSENPKVKYGTGWCEGSTISLEEAALSDPALEKDAYFIIGLLHYFKGDYYQAENAVKKAIQINSSDPTFHNLLGLIFKEQNKKADIKKREWNPPLTDLNERKAELLKEKAELLKDVGKSSIAICDLKSAGLAYRLAAYAHPGDVDTHVNLGLTLARSGHLSAAEDHLKKAAVLDPISYRLRLKETALNQEHSCGEHIERQIGLQPWKREMLLAQFTRQRDRVEQFLVSTVSR